jgi:ABC-type amino acid transport substrate-binding protein
MPLLATDGDMLMHLATKKIDVAITNRGIAHQFIQKNPNQIRLLTEEPLRVQGNTIALQADEVKLWATLTSALNELQNAGIVNRLIDQYNAQVPHSFLKATPKYQEINTQSKTIPTQP